MRRAALLTTVTLLPFLAATLAAACGGDDNGTTHGVVIGDDSGQSSDGTVIPRSDGAAPEQDGATPDDSSTGTDSGSCTTGTLALVGGGVSGSFASVATGSGAFTAQNFATDPIAALPAVIAFGAGFQAVFHAAGSNALLSTGFASGTWSAPATIAGTLVREAPTLAATGSTLHVVYQANDDAGADQFKYFHGTYATSWTAGDPVGAGAGQSNGPHTLGAAGLAAELVTGQVGGDKNIYARSFTTAWQAALQVGTGVGSNDGNLGTAAHVVAMTGGTAELLAIYTRDADFKIMSTARAGGTWATTPTLSNADAFTTEPFQAAALPGGKAVVAWRGGDTHGYITVYDGTNWSAPFAVAPFAISSAPGVSAGNCGSEIVAAYAKLAGTVELVRTDGATLQTPVAVAGATNVKFVAIAVSP